MDVIEDVKLLLWQKYNIVSVGGSGTLYERFCRWHDAQKNISVKSYSRGLITGWFLTLLLHLAWVLFT